MITEVLFSTGHSMILWFFSLEYNFSRTTDLMSWVFGEGALRPIKKSGDKAIPSRHYSKPKYFHFLDAAGLFWLLHLYCNLCTGSQLSQSYLLLICNLWTGSLVAYSAGHILMLGVASMRFYCSQGKARLGSSAVLNLSHHFCDSACI